MADYERCSLFEIKQEARLPLRNRASTMHFFPAKLLSIYVYHLRNLRPMIRLITHTAAKLQHATAARTVRMTRDATVV